MASLPCCALFYGIILCCAVLRAVMFKHCFVSCVSCLVLRGVVDDVVVALLFCCCDDDLAIAVMLLVFLCFRVFCMFCFFVYFSGVYFVVHLDIAGTDFYSHLA